MPITVACVCGKRYAVGEQLAGKAVNCPTCGQAISVPAGAPQGFPPAPAPLPGMAHPYPQPGGYPQPPPGLLPQGGFAPQAYPGSSQAGAFPGAATPTYGVLPQPQVGESKTWLWMPLTLREP
jgi:hypothetical protein